MNNVYCPENERGSAVIGLLRCCMAGWWYRCVEATSTRRCLDDVWNEAWRQTVDCVASSQQSVIEREASLSLPVVSPASVSGCITFTAWLTIRLVYSLRPSKKFAPQKYQGYILIGIAVQLRSIFLCICSLEHQICVSVDKRASGDFIPTPLP